MFRFLSLLLAFSIIPISSIYGESGGDVEKEDYYAIMFLIDAVHPKLFVDMIEAGELPNMKKHIYDKGLLGKNFISVFPTVSAPAIASIFTGVYPGKHNITAFQWFNRKDQSYRSYIGIDILKFDADLRRNAKPIFDYFDKGDTASFGIITGSTTGRDDSLLFTAMNPFHRMAPFTHLKLTDMLSKFKIGKGIPHFMSIYEWKVDHRGHRSGAFGEPVKEVMRNVDQRIGALVQNYEKRGILDKTYFVIISDHGLASVKESFYIDTMLEEIGLNKRIISYNLGESYVPFYWGFKKPLFPFDMERVDTLFSVPIYQSGYNVVVGSNAGGVATIDFAKNGGFDANDKWTKLQWQEEVVYNDLLNYYKGPNKGHINIIEFLKDIEGIDFFIVKDAIADPLKVRVVAKRGMALITRNKDTKRSYMYEVLLGEDPLRYDMEPLTKNLIDGKFHSGKDWLNASKDIDYPDACVQFTQIFDSDHAGTVILSCAEGWGVNSKVVAKHGGYLSDETRATFCVSGPGINKGIIGCARSVDVVPSLLFLLDRKFGAEDFDGEVIPQLREAVIKRGE